VGGDGGEQGIGGPRLPVPELPFLSRAEPAGARLEQLLPPGLARAVAPAQQRDAGPALADRGQFGDPVHPVVVHVPQSGEDPAGGEHPGDLRHRAVQVEPVHGLTGQHRVHAGVGQRQLLRAPRRRTYLRHRPPQLGQHLRVGLDRGHLGAQPGQRRGQLAGSRAEVGDADRLAVPDRLERPPDRGLGIVGAVLGVGRGGGAERRAVPQPLRLLGRALVARCAGRRDRLVHAGESIRPGGGRRRRPGRLRSRAGGCPPS
jgi:hypothetical protein